MFLSLVAWGLIDTDNHRAFAADPTQCLSAVERRAAITEKRAVPLARAVRAARARVNAEIVRARLCQDSGLVYQLTMLARDGKVVRATVDAVTGQLLGNSR